jgi:hypothetical protein
VTIPLPSAFKSARTLTESTGGARWRLLPPAIERCAILTLRDEGAHMSPEEPVAQPVEHLTFNQGVPGSNPGGLTKFPNKYN